MALAHTAATYTISRIRLINFHNFVDEILDVRHGGHLFLLGDNASGKTTVLDAVHYVLTAGESMEFNSAARVAGGREDGRRVQGVIMRYNVDTGPLNPKGGITYAALEIVGRHGNPTTIAVGMSVRSMDEKVSRWGIVRECALEEIPFIITDLHGRRPADRQEMRDFFGRSNGYFSSMSGYQREIAQRFFNTWEVFLETCRLLSMGKAYREIVAHADDYHQLFRRLLPEPRTDIFEQIIEALRTLDQSEEELRALEEKHTYLAGLEELIASVAALREERLCLEWLRQYRLADEIQVRIETYDTLKNRRVAELSEIEREIAACLEHQEQQQRAIDDLKSKDASGLISQEREQRADLEQLTRDLASRREKHAQISRQLEGDRETVIRERTDLTQNLVEFLTGLEQQGLDLPFSLGELITAVDAVRRLEYPETGLAALPQNVFRERAIQTARPLEAELAVVEHRISEMRNQGEEVGKTMADFESRGEALPEIPGFMAALTALREQMISVVPMYAGLEWAAGLDDHEKAALEAAIGQEVLATLVIRSDHYGEARAIVLGNYPGIRLAMAPAEPVDMPAWIRQNIDLRRSDPAAVQCLVLEMESRTGLELTGQAGVPVLRFRGHERQLTAPHVRLIGQEGRRESLQRDVQILRERLTRMNGETDELARTRTRIRETLDRLHALLQTLNTSLPDIMRRGQEISDRSRALEFAEREMLGHAERMEELEQQVQWRQERLTRLQALIEKEGLDKLEQAMCRAREKLHGYREREAEARTRAGAIQNQIKGIDESMGRLADDRKACGEHMHATAGTLLARHPEVTDIETFVLDTRAGEKYEDVAGVDRALAALRKEEGVHLGQLDIEVRHPTFGATFGFIYDEMSNELLDRRSRRVHDLTGGLRHDIEEQRQVINERTFSLFRKLIMEGLLSFLSQYVRELRTMVKRINRLLGNRRFGRNMYGIQVRDVERYRRLIEIVEHYNPFETARAEEELREFFEDHKDELLRTEINEVPEVLDYRNWFHYDLRVQTLDGDGVIIDRRTKSVGSGGEQAVPNYLLILTVADFLFQGNAAKLKALIFDEAFYGIDAGRRDQIMGFATDLGLQLLVASPDQDGVKQEVAYSTTVFIVKDADCDVHLYPYHWENPDNVRQFELFSEAKAEDMPVEFGEEL